MAEQKFLVGTYREKCDVERLLFKNLPGDVSFEYALLCNSLIQRLYENGCESFQDFDCNVAEFLYEFKTDLQERSQQYQNEFEEYLQDIENALGMLKSYFFNLDLFPIPSYMKAEEGTYGTVLMLTVKR